MALPIARPGHQPGQRTADDQADVPGQGRIEKRCQADPGSLSGLTDFSAILETNGKRNPDF